MANRLLQNLLARRVALRLVRLKRHRPIEFAIHFEDGKVRLPRNEDTVLAGNPGIYSLRFYEKRSRSLFGKSVTADFHKLGHATLDQLDSEVRVENAARLEHGTLMRSVASVEEGNLANAIGGWISGWLGTKPEHFDAGIADVEIESEDAWRLPSWLQVRLGDPSNAWVIHVHGRGATPAETARNFKHLEKLGFNNLSISYRNDGTALKSGRVERGTLGLGTTEWVDLEAAVAFAKANGAKRILVFGWSYGAAISTQFAARSELARDVQAYIFDSPVISWRSTLDYQVKLSGAPLEWLALGENYLSDASNATSLGLPHAINFDDFEISALAESLDKPVLLLHSADDGYIPIEPCRELAAAMPDTVELVEFEKARHCKLYNFDAEKYQTAIERFIAAQPLD